MSTTHKLAPITRDDLQFLVKDYMPESEWTVGGAFRFDISVQSMVKFLREFVLVRRVEHVAGVLPCSWSLDWFVERRPMGLADLTAHLETYASLNVGVAMVFDNPCITPDMVDDAYGRAALEALYKCDRVRKNAVYVASEPLAERIRSLFPKLPLYCHVNRLVMEKGKRSADLYNRLAERYDRVCLHPQDAVRPSIYGAIKTPARFDVVVNDPCLRTCPMRRAHMKLLADIRRHPYDMVLASDRNSMIDRNGCHAVNAEALPQKRSLNLTRAELDALYNAGFRSMIVQGNQFRNEMTLLWDLFRCLLDHSPELTNKAALIAASAMAQFGVARAKLTSGLKQFQFSNYE